MEDDPKDEPTIPGIIGEQLSSIPLVNDHLSVPTHYFDAVQGAAVGPWVTKITLIESFPPLAEGEPITGRAVFNISFPTPQLRAIGELFTRLANELDEAMKNGRFNG